MKGFHLSPLQSGEMKFFSVPFQHVSARLVDYSSKQGHGEHLWIWLVLESKRLTTSWCSLRFRRHHLSSLIVFNLRNTNQDISRAPVDLCNYRSTSDDHRHAVHTLPCPKTCSTRAACLCFALFSAWTKKLRMRVISTTSGCDCTNNANSVLWCIWPPGNARTQNN